MNGNRCRTRPIPVILVRMAMFLRSALRAAMIFLRSGDETSPLLHLCSAGGLFYGNPTGE